MAANPSYVILEEAYYKLFFHAAKHPHKPVNGVLLGKIESKTRLITIVDAIPLLHHWTSLSPMMEIGLDLAFQHAELEGLKVVGYYQACERLDDTILAPIGETVATKVKVKFEDAIAFVIDGRKLGGAEAALVPYIAVPSTSNWRPSTSDKQPFSPGSRFQLSSPTIPADAAKLVQEQNLHLVFGDFDDHLEDVTIDWLRNRACLPA